MPIRRTNYLKNGRPITLAFVSCVADQHPEIDDKQTPAPKPPKFNPSRRALRRLFAKRILHGSISQNA